MRAAIGNLLQNDALERLFSLSTVLGFSPEHPVAGVEDQNLPPGVGNVVLRTIYAEFRKIVGLAFPAERVGLYTGTYGEKEPLIRA